MARIGVLLLLLIQWSNLYAWSCWYQNGSDGWYLEGSMYCEGISVESSLSDHYCVWYRPDDPVCTQYQEVVCTEATEFKTEACPQNFTGGINFSRSYSCATLSWSGWVETSSNCTPLPPSCIETTESRTMACPSGYEGYITETRISSCPDPYGEPQWLEWHQTEDGCTQSVSDPVSPISVTSPSNPVSPTAIESAIVPPIDVEQTTESVVMEKLQDSMEESKDKTQEVSQSTDTEQQDNNDRSEESRDDREDTSVDSTKELVHGFGYTLSLDILNKPMEFYQPPLEDAFSILQEFPISEDTRAFQLNLFRQDNIENHYFSDSNYTWDRLRRRDILE